MAALILEEGDYWRRALNRINAAELQLNNNFSSIYNLLRLTFNPEYIFGGETSLCV